MDTKQRIEHCALALFSTRGYAGVSIRQIAARVGIKESSIYKHYASKEEIFNTIQAHYLERVQHVFSPVGPQPSAFVGISSQALVQLLKDTFQAFAGDEYLCQCRRLLMISAPSDARIGALYAGSFITQPIAFNTSVFQCILNEAGRTDLCPQAMAYQFYSPVFCILQELDYGVLNMQQALDKIEEVTRQFRQVYAL